MTEATLTWSIWQALLQAFACSFTRRGFRRFAEWITAMALNVEEHTITQSVLALEQPAAWKALESFAEYGGWHEGRVTYDLTRLVADRPGPALARLLRLGRRRHQGPSLQPARLGHLHLPRVHRPLPQPRQHRPRPQLGRPRRAAPRAGQAGLVPADHRPALLPQVAVAGRARRHAGVPDQVRAGRRAAPRAGADRPRPQAPGRLRRRLRPAERGAAAGPARGRRPARIDVLTRLRHDARLFALPPPIAPPGPGGRSRSGAGGWTRPAAAAAGSGGGGPAAPSSTAGSGRSAGRRWSACGGCWGGRCRSRRSWPRSRGTRSGSRW